MATGSDSGGAECDVSMPGCSDWTSVTDTKKTRKPRIAEDNVHNVYIAGKDTNLSKINPIALSEKMEMKFRIVERIFLPVASLKIYCTSLEQKNTLLEATLLYTSKTRNIHLEQ